MKAVAVLNADSGQVVHADPEELARRVREGMERCGADTHVELVHASELSDTLRRLADSDADRILIGGGDGTTRSAAEILGAAGKPFGVLPLGTFNLLARELQVPLDLDESIPALLRGEVKHIDAGRVNGRLFLHNATLGFFARIMRGRERGRGGRLDSWRRVAPILIDIVRRNERLHVDIEIEGKHDRLPAAAVMVAVNEYEERPSLFPHREDLAGGELVIYVGTHHGPLDMLRLGVSLAGGRWRQDPNVRMLRARSLVIHSPARRVDMVSDGEIERVEPPLHYEVLPQHLAVVVPGREASAKAA